MAEPSEKQTASKETELLNKFLQLRKEGIKKGLSEKEISTVFRQNIKRSWKDLLSTKTFQTQVLVTLVAVALASKFFLPDLLDEFVFEPRCLISNNPIFSEMARPLANCDICKDLKSVPIEYGITVERFINNYAYTKIPVLIKDATKNWTAMDTFSFHYFQDLYRKTEGSLKSVDEECQFFPYKTEFYTLEEAFNMSDERARFDPGERPWYFGWSNCHRKVAAELRSHYERPHFLPEDSESSTLDWIFMGGPGLGAFIHLDSVQRPSWQAQITGVKTWTLLPSPECESVCHELNVTVHRGDIIVLDTNEWYHATFIHKGEASITIGSEYD